MEKTQIIGVVMLILGLLLSIYGGAQLFNRFYIVEPQYQRLIGDYALNACDSPTFELTIKYVQQFNDSMTQQGLTPDQYNSPWSWDQTPQNGMTFEYQYTTAMVARAHYYKALVDNATIGLSKGSTAFTDILNQSLSNFHKECNRNGPLDWVAHNAWLLKYHVDAYWANLWGWLALIVDLIVAVVGVVAVLPEGTFD